MAVIQTSTPKISPRVSTKRWRLRPFTFLPPSNPTGPLFRRFDRLTVNDSGAGLLLLPHRPTVIFPQLGMHLGQQPTALPAVKATGDRLPGRIIVREHAPLAPGAADVEDGIQDAAAVPGGRAPSWRRTLEQGTYSRPLRVGQIAGVGGDRGSTAVLWTVACSYYTRGGNRHVI